MALEVPEQFNLAAHFVDAPGRDHPERVAIAGLGPPVSYAELREMMNRAGNALIAEECRPGDRVLLLLPDSPEFFYTFFAATKIGAIAVPVNPMTRAPDFSHYLQDSGAHIAVVHQMALAEFRQAGLGESLRRTVVVGAGPSVEHPWEIPWEDWLRGASRNLLAYPSAAEDPAFILYTSGSSGKPKGAIHAHKGMLVTSQSFARHVLRIHAGDTVYSASKLYFAYGLGNSMYFPLSVGARLVLNPERPRPDKIAEILAQYRPTLFFAVPTVYAALLREAERGLAVDFSPVRCAISAGEALPPELLAKLRAKFGLEVLDGIGSTEMLHMFISSRSGKARAGSCGVPVPGYEAMVLDEAGQPAADGEIGSLWVKGGSALQSYWNRPDLTATVKRGEWVATGDKFYRDSSGYYFYCGRSDDMMKVSGLWVSPGEVENALLGHPAVAEAAVVGARDDNGLIQLVAYLVLNDGKQASPQTGKEVQNAVRGVLPAYKCPQVIRFLAELPKTATGKVQRFRLREMAKE
jgi:benzoate-CoA ligase